MRAFGWEVRRAQPMTKVTVSVPKRDADERVLYALYEKRALTALSLRLAIAGLLTPAITEQIEKAVAELDLPKRGGYI